MTAAVLGLACVLLAGAIVRGQDADDVFARRPAGTARALEQYQAERKAHAGNQDVLVLPGLTADRKRRTVDVLAECTGLPGGEAVEFLLVDQDSSHGYEALLWSLAKPSDVHRALEFIGLKPGAPRQPALPRLGADGDRVTLTVRQAGHAAFPAERLILDKETEKTLPEDGFVFAGSCLAAPPDGKGPQQYVADLYDPRTVAPLFNDPAAVLDLPRRAEQGEVYDRQVVNPAHVFEQGRLLTVVMAPDERTVGRPTSRLLRLAANRSAGARGTVFRLSETNGAILVEGAELTPVLERLAACSKADQAAPRLGLSFGETMPIPEVARACAVMALLESLGAVRINPPTDGQLYYRAFLPDEAWRSAQGRPSQPWELHLRLRDGTATGTMIWNDPAGRAKRKTLDVPTPERLWAALEADVREREQTGQPALPAVLLVFAGPGLSYGQAAHFLAPVLPTHGTVYVFAETPDAPATHAERRGATTRKATP